MCSRMATANIKENSQKKCSLIFVIHGDRLHSHYKLLDPGKRKAHRLDSRPAVTAQRLPGNSWFESIQTVRTHSKIAIVWCQVQLWINMIQYGFVMVCVSSSPTALLVALPMSVIFCASGMCLITASEDATLLGDSSETQRLGSEKLTLWMGSSSDAWHTSCNISQLVNIQIIQPAHAETKDSPFRHSSNMFQHVPSLAVLSGTHQPIACTKMCLA